VARAVERGGPVNVGILLLRLLLAGLIACHAAYKLLGWFNGPGVSGMGVTFEEWGLRPGRVMVVTAGVCEVLGAGSVALGLLMPGGCALIVGTMAVAASINAPKGFWERDGGCELAVVYSLTAGFLAFIGAGRWSLDHVAGLALHGVVWGAAALGAGLLAALVVVLRRYRLLRLTPRTT
jgi:putative oxidoreductase